MDDYNISTIIDSKNEWCARLTNILTPSIIEGIKSIFEEAYKMCIENDEESKYLMTFQNLLNNIPKWSSQIVQQERERIETSSACSYLEDLITCVHITQLKSLTSSRAGLKQKKINIDIPNLNTFIHKTYINVARKIYVNVYLFEKDIMPLLIQKNNRELEIIVKECILNTIRENIPVENILKIYLDETQETDVLVEETRDVIPDKEAILRQQKEEKEKELERVKEEVKEKMRQESKESLSKALKNANKSLNTVEENNSKNNKPDKSPETSDFETDPETDTDYTTDEEPNTHGEKLVFDDTDNTNLDIGVKNLDEDPDKFDLDVLDLDVNTQKMEDEIDLGIEEL